MSRSRPPIGTGRADRGTLEGGRTPARRGETAGGRGAEGSAGGAWRVPGEAVDDDAAIDDDFDPAELREFLAADLLDVEADPIFKERLRQKLWRLVRMRFGDGEDEG